MADTPEAVEPTGEYLGVVCAACGQTFPIIGPLDPVQMPPDKPFRVGAREPLHGTCPHCQHRADYPVDKLLRIRAA